MWTLQNVVETTPVPPAAAGQPPVRATSDRHRQQPMIRPGLQKRYKKGLDIGTATQPKLIIYTLHNQSLFVIQSILRCLFS
jgi:hypothetical protein